MYRITSKVQRSSSQKAFHKPYLFRLSGVHCFSCGLDKIATTSLDISRVALTGAGDGRGTRNLEDLQVQPELPWER